MRGCIETPELGGHALQMSNRFAQSQPIQIMTRNQGPVRGQQWPACNPYYSNVANVPNAHFEQYLFDIVSLQTRSIGTSSWKYILKLNGLLVAGVESDSGNGFNQIVDQCFTSTRNNVIFICSHMYKHVNWIHMLNKCDIDCHYWSQKQWSQMNRVHIVFTDAYYGVVISKFQQIRCHMVFCSYCYSKSSLCATVTSECNTESNRLPLYAVRLKCGNGFNEIVD